MLQKKNLIISKSWLIFFVFVLLLVSLLIFVAVGTIYWVLSSFSITNTRLDVLFLGYELRSNLRNLAYVNWIRLLLLFMGLFYYFVIVASYLIFFVESQCYFVRYPNVWNFYTCFKSLILLQPLSNSFTLFFKFYDRFILNNKSSTLSSRLVLKIFCRLAISVLTAVSWCYLEFIWYCIIALYKDQQTPIQTFVNLYEELVFEKLIFKNEQYVNEAFTTIQGTLETRPYLHY
jgi:hypothetical protein